MTAFGWRLVQWMARALDAEEREAALGDLAERQSSAGAALLDIGGLIARRQAALWRTWQPSAALAGIVAPVFALALDFTDSRAPRLDLYLWILYNYAHFETKTLEEFGLTSWRVLGVMGSYACLSALWSWTGGLALGSLARRASWLHVGVLCCLVVTMVGRARWEVFAAAAVTLLAPLICGAWLGARQGTPRTRCAVTTAAALGVALLGSVWIGGWLRDGLWHASEPVAAAVLCWPAAYLVATAMKPVREEAR